MTTKTQARVALVTGGTAGLGLALTRALAADGWHVITDGRNEGRIKEADFPPTVATVVGDITDADHRSALVEQVRERGRLDLLVHNASTLGPLPMKHLGEVAITEMSEAWRTNVGAPLVLTGELSAWLRPGESTLVSISSDAAVHHYETWGLYGAGKAALDHVTLTFGAETGVAAYAVDPGDMRTQMHQDAFPGEDISDRPLPETVVPHLLRLLEQRPESGRYLARDF